ncbi:MAG: hypothetical protein EXR09_05545 [Acetobacteraceae bacterium]|nr:hypothetical protein [Acetobacteraceae bacterium]
MHFKATAKTEQLVRQMYFQGEDWNDRDPWLNSSGRKDDLMVDPQTVSGKEPGAFAVTFDIVLARG